MQVMLFYFGHPFVPVQCTADVGAVLSAGDPGSTAALSAVFLVLLLVMVVIILYHKRKYASGMARLQEDLHESEQRFQSLVMTSNDWIWHVDAEMTCVYSSPQVLSILGYKPDEVIGKKPFDFMPAPEAERVRAAVKTAVSRRIPFWRLEYQCLTKDGRVIVLESNGVPFFDKAGQFKGYRGVNQDITERRLAETESEEYRRRMESLIGNLYGVAYRCLNTPDWPIEFISRGCLELTGYSPLDFVSRRVLLNDLIHPDDRNRVWGQVQQALAERRLFNLEYRLTDRRGQLHWVVERGCGVWDKDRLEALEGLIVDITEHKLAQQQLQLSREFLESIIRSVPTGISVTVDRVFVNVNDRFCEMFGCARDDVIGRSTRMFHPTQQSYDELTASLYGPMRKNGTASAEVRFIKKDGTPIDVLLNGAPIDPNDWSRGITFSLLDITERKRMTEQLAMRLKLERLVADLSGGFVNLPMEDIDRQIFKSLQMLVEQLGIERVRLALINHETHKVLLSAYFSADDSSQTVFIETDDMDRDMPEYAALIRQNRVVWWPTVRDIPESLPSVRRFFAEKSICSHLCIPMTVGQDHAGALMITNLRHPLSIDHDVLGFLHVIADTLANALVRKKTLEALEYSERRFRSIIELSPMGIHIYHLLPDNTLIFVGTNRAASKILSFNAEPFIGRPIEEVFPELAKSGLNDIYRRLCRDGGSHHGSNFIYQDEHVKGIYEFEAFQILPGKIAVMFADVTERNLAERARERLMRQLRAKNEELESLVYIASHDLRSPLVNIRGFSGELEKSLIELRGLLSAQPLSESARKRVDELFRADVAESFGFINSGTAKMESMLDGLLRLSRIGTAQSRPQRLHLRMLLEQVIHQFRFVIKAENLTVEIAANLPDCMGDPLLISQAFSNLIDNAVKYRSPSRPLKIRIEGDTSESAIEYRVIDNGIGIAAEHIQKVFDIFHRLNPSGDNGGQGLGLTIVRKIIENHDGRIWIESSQDTGTTVFIRLPRD